MPITITREHYQNLYQNKFSARGCALLKNEETLSEAEKALFCTETLLKFDSKLKFDPNSITQDDLKDLMLVLKFIVDKNISNGEFIEILIKTNEDPSHGIMQRRETLDVEDLKNEVFVSSMVLLSFGEHKERDFKEIADQVYEGISEKIKVNSAREKERWVVHAMELAKRLITVNEPKSVEFSALLEDLASQFKKDYKLDLGKIPSPTGIRLFFINACRILANFIEPTNKNSFFSIIRIPKWISRGFNYLADSLSTEDSGLIRQFFIYIFKGISDLFDPENPGNLFSMVQVFDFVSWIFRMGQQYLERGHLRNAFISGKVDFNKEKGLLDKVVDKPPLDRVQDEQHLQEEVDLKRQDEDRKKVELEITASDLNPKSPAPIILSSRNNEIKEEKEKQENEELGAVQIKDSKLWIISHSEDINEAIQKLSGKQLDEISSQEYQALMVGVVLELDKIGTIKNKGIPVDSGAYSIVDADNKVFKFFETYYKKVEKEHAGKKNIYAYDRDPYTLNFGLFSVKVTQSSHPGAQQMGFDVRGENGELINVFEGTSREGKTHVLVGHLGDGQTYLKLEKIGIGTNMDYVKHGVDYIATRKPIARVINFFALIGHYLGFSGYPTGAGVPRKEHDIKQPIIDAYLRIEKQFIKIIPKILGGDNSLEIMKKSGQKIIQKIEAREEDEWFIVESVEHAGLKIPKFIFEMYENLQLLGSHCDDEKTASELIAQFEAVCAENGYPLKELQYRHGNEILINLAEDITRLAADENQNPADRRNLSP